MSQWKQVQGSLYSFLEESNQPKIAMMMIVLLIQFMYTSILQPNCEIILQDTSFGSYVWENKYYGCIYLIDVSFINLQTQMAYIRKKI